jgi:hypothetical protein
LLYYRFGDVEERDHLIVRAKVFLADHRFE